MPDPTPALAGSAVALLMWVLACLARGDDGASVVSLVLAALAPMAAALTAYLLQNQSLALPPQKFIDAGLLAGVLALPVGIAVGHRGGRGASIFAASVFAIAATLLFWRFTETLHERYWDGRVAVYVASLTGLAVLGYAARLGATALDRTAEVALGTGLAALAASPALGWSGTGVSALTVAAVSASAGLFGLLLVGRPAWRPNSARLGRASATTQSMLIAAIVANGVLYAETPKKAGALLVAAPVLHLLPGRSTVAAALRLTLIAVICGTAAWLSKGKPNPYGY